MACSIRLPLDNLGVSASPVRCLQARHSCGAAGGGSATAAASGGDVDRLQQFLASSEAPAGQGAGTSAAEQQQLLQVMPPLPGHGEWGRFKARRHLRRRQVERPAPEAMIQAAEAKQQQQQPQERQEQGAAAAAAAAVADQGHVLQHVQAAAQHAQAAGQELQAAAVDAAADAAAAVQRAEQAALGSKAAATLQHQLASLQQLSQQQLANLAQAAQHAKHQLAAVVPGRQRASIARPQQQQQQQQQQTAQQLGVQPQVPQQTAAAAAAARKPLSSLNRTVQQAARATSVQVERQVAGLQQAGRRLQARLQHKQAASTRQQAAAAPAAALQTQQAQQQVAAQRQQAVAQPQPARRTAAARHAVATQPVAPPPSSQAASHAGMGRFVLAWVLGAAASALLLLRLLWARRRKARTAQEAIREAEQRARAAKLYDRQRQRFQRALLAAEDLEGADSSVFAAVSRKGSTNGAPAAPAQDGSDAGSGGAASAGSNPFLREVPGGAAAAAAAALASADMEEEEDEASSADVFDPASWDDDVRRQWESFVSSSKVNKGKLWDTSQVDEGLPEPVGSAQAATAAPGDPSGSHGDPHSGEVAEEVLKEGLPRDPESVANKALKEAARELEHREALTRQDHTIPKGGLAAEAQSAAAHRLHPEESEVAALVRRRVAAEMGGPDAEALADAIIEAAEARAARQPLEKRPHTVEELLQAGASELEHRESAEGKRHGRHGLAARAQSAADRAAHGRHPAVEDKVLEKLNQPGSGFCQG
ncbi:hypothetical protein ABPG75_011099 [Micractinium tetrahymenae]